VCPAISGELFSKAENPGRAACGRMLEAASHADSEQAYGARDLPNVKDCVSPVPES
jgi:hypothetical protein